MPPTLTERTFPTRVAIRLPPYQVRSGSSVNGEYQVLSTGFWVLGPQDHNLALPAPLPTHPSPLTTPHSLSHPRQPLLEQTLDEGRQARAVVGVAHLLDGLCLRRVRMDRFRQRAGA